MIRFLDATLGKVIRHLFFVLLRGYYALFYNVSCSGKHVLQQQPGTLLLATHVSRHDGPIIASILYTTTRVRPTVHWNEYNHWGQWLPMWIGSAIPMSSPKEWAPEDRLAQKQKTLKIIHKVLGNGSAVLLFPAGKVRRQPEELVPAYLSGVYEILNENPDIPVQLLRIDGLGQFQRKVYDGFWSFLFIKNGRRHVSMDLTPIKLDPSLPVEEFNQRLEALLNTEITQPVLTQD